MKKGFTLIELLVVVLIIGILAAIALPQYTKAVERSRSAEAMQHLGDLATAQSIYYMTNNSFAPAFSTLNANGDVTVPEITNDTTSYNYSISRTPASGSDLEQVVMTATRNGGMYGTDAISITVKSDGSISKSCTGDKGLCTVTTSGGYKAS